MGPSGREVVDMPNVSIITPNYNHEHFLQRRVASILCETLHDLEVILVDDCYSDDSHSILASYTKDPRVRTEFNDAHSGRTFNRWNRAFG